MKLHPAQAQVVADTHRFRVVNAGRRFGKTVLAIEELLFAAVSRKDGIIAYIGPTYMQAREISWEMLKRRVSEVPGTQINETRLEMSVPNKFGGTSKIILKGWESIESLRGQRYDFLVLDEVAMYRNFDMGWQEVIRPTLTDTKGKVLFISTPQGFNFWFELFNREMQDPDYKSFQFTSYDNPFVPPEEIDKARQELTQDRFEQEYMASFRKTEGLVYKEFDRLKHLTELKPTNVIRKIAGVDFGFTNPSVILTVHVDNDRNYWVIDEWYRTGKTNPELIEYAKTLDVATFYPDPAEPARIEEMRRAGLICAEVNKDIPKGIDSVRSLFKNSKLYIHRSCRNLIRELETYSYKEKQPDRNEPELPIPEDDHCLDALRYALFMQSPIPAVQPIRKEFRFEGDIVTY